MLSQRPARSFGQITAHRQCDHAKPTAGHANRGWRKWEAALIAVAIAAPISLVWGFELFPTVDGPAHVHLAYALAESLRGDTFYQGLVEVNSKLSPNMTVQGVLVALMMAASPFVAEKLWLSLYFAGFAVAGAYALSGINRKAVCLLPFLMMCSVTFTLAYGFYNFAFSSVVFFGWFGFWWRHRDRISIGVILGHAAFAAAAYVTHIFALVLSLLGIGAATAGVLLLQYMREDADAKRGIATLRRPLLSHALPPLLASTPEIFACLHFLLLRFSQGTATGVANFGKLSTDRFHQFLAGSSLAPYDSAELVPAIALLLLSILILCLLCIRGGQFRDALPFAVCFGVFLLLYFLIPERWIVRWMPERFQPLVFIVLIFWLAALIPVSLRLVRWQLIGAAGTALLFVTTVLRWEIFGELNDYYREIASASQYVSENSTLIALRLHKEIDGKPFPARSPVFIQIGSRIATARHSVDLKNFQGKSSAHPIQYRSGVWATAVLGGEPAVTASPPRIDLMAYEWQTGRPIDYILVYGFPKAVGDQDALHRLDAQLNANYRLAFVSHPTGIARLFSRRPALESSIGGRTR